jgi:hypothetical protein
MYLNNTQNGAVKLSPWTNDEIDQMINARLDLPTIHTLRQNGYKLHILK